MTKKNKEYLQKIESLTIICKSTTRKPKKQNKKNKVNSKRLDFTQSEIEEPDHHSSRCTQSAIDDQDLSQNQDLQSHENEDEQEKCDILQNNSILTDDILKPKLHILSSNKDNKILNIVNNKMSEMFSICHYLTPNCNTKHLLKDIEHKLVNFTMKDFCVIFLMEENFKTVYEYFELIKYIRLKLQKITHTNVIMCVPSYKYGSQFDDYNWNVELFINLLHLDNMTHKYSYMLDTNLNVP